MLTFSVYLAEMRKYSPIWTELKAKGICKIAAPISSHDTIIRGVKKEKCLDVAFKLLTTNKGKKFNLEIAADADVGLIVFTLAEVSYITVESLGGK